MGFNLSAGGADLCRGLWVAVLGGAEGAVGHRGGDAGDDSGVHCDRGGVAAAYTAADLAALRGAGDRACGCRGTDEPLAKSGRSADQHGGCDGSDCCGDLLVGGDSDEPEVAAADVEGAELG